MANNNNKDPHKEVKKEDVLMHCEIYKEHFTEKVLVERAEIFVYNFCFNHGILGKDSGWEGGRAVYAQLPFGDDAMYIASKNGKKVVVKAEIIPDEEKIILSAIYGKIKEQRVIEHLTIKHGYINWLDEQPPVINIEGIEFVDENPFPKKDIPTDTNVKPRQQRQPQVMPPGYGYGFYL